MTGSGLSVIFEDFISLLYPHYCFACSGALVKGEQILCTFCMRNLPRTNYHREPDNILYKKLAGRIPVSSASALFHFHKSSKVQHLLHAFKYENHPEIGEFLGRMYGSELKAVFEDIDCIIPIPLHRTKLRRRGFNQSECFGQGLAESMEIACLPNAVQRLVKTNTQTRKNRLSRWENVSNVFHVKDPIAIKDKNILLIDDIVTTGATLEACAQVLFREGCGGVHVTCLAFAQ